MAQYPGAAASDANLYVAVNSLATTLAGALTSSGGNNGANIEVTSTTGFPATGFITIDQEAISYTSILSGPPRFAGIVRGADGTTATSHAAGSTTKHNVIAAHHNAPKDEIIAIETDLVSVKAAITPVTPTSTATNILNRIAMIVFQIKALHGNLTNWYDTIAGGYQPLFVYKRPTLIWNSVTSVGIERGISPNVISTTTAAVIFPDGQLRTDSSTTRIDFDITRNAVFNGSNQSGLRSGQSESVNTWYAIYAVKCQNNSTDFVLVGDCLLPPSRGNIPNLNTAYGTNGWVYLGYIRNGDNSGATGDILRFQQVGFEFLFNNNETDIAGNGGIGTRLASAAATSITWTFTPGMGVGSGGTAVDVPVTYRMKLWAASGGPSAASEFVGRNAANSRRYFDISLATGNRGVQMFDYTSAAIAENITVTGTTTGSGLDLNLVGWQDLALADNAQAGGGN